MIALTAIRSPSAATSWSPCLRSAASRPRAVVGGVERVPVGGDDLPAGRDDALELLGAGADDGVGDLPRLCAAGLGIGGDDPVSDSDTLIGFCVP